MGKEERGGDVSNLDVECMLRSSKGCHVKKREGEEKETTRQRGRRTGGKRGPDQNHLTPRRNLLLLCSH